jgi:hypothetical protein
MKTFDKNSKNDRVLAILFYQSVLRQLFEELETKYPAKLFPVSSLGKYTKENITDALNVEIVQKEIEIKNAYSNHGAIMISPISAIKYNFESARRQIKDDKELLESLSHFIDDNEAKIKNGLAKL